jgi:hypothetical protein
VIGVAEMENHLAEMANNFRWREDIGSPILGLVPTTSPNHLPIVLIDKKKSPDHVGLGTQENHKQLIQKDKPP